MSNQKEAAGQEVQEVNGHIEMGEALERLMSNKDFNLVILDGYLKNEVLSSVSLLGVPAISARGERAAVMEDLISASNLQYYFQTVESFYLAATDPVYSDEELAEMAAEEEGVTNV